MFRIAWNNLTHDRLKFAAAVIGVAFAITLIAIQTGIFLGAIDSSALLVWQSKADLWIVPEQAVNADFALDMPERRMYQALGVPGVQRTGRLIVGTSVFKFNSGRQELVITVGIDQNHDWLGVERYRTPGVLADRWVLFDHREQERFAENGRPLTVGDRAELGGHAIEVAGFVPDKSSFVATPYVFCRYESALNFVNLPEGRTTFILVQCAPGADVAQVRDELQRRMPDTEVLERGDFAERSWRYWVLGTGMGMALGLSAGLAFTVGLVIVGQTIFTSVLSRLREYATLKAVGFTNRFVVGVVVLQSLAVLVVGYPLAVAATLVFAYFAGQGGSAVVISVTPALLLAMVPVAAAMCGLASLGAVAKALRVPPAKVFR